jgi:hypothetical protein
MKQNILKLKDVVAQAKRLLAGDIEAEPQDVVITRTIDYKNGSTKRPSAWQGYMMQFSETDKGKVEVPVSAGLLLTIAEENDKVNEVFTQHKDGSMTLKHLKWGVKDGQFILG